MTMSTEEINARIDAFVRSIQRGSLTLRQIETSVSRWDHVATQDDIRIILAEVRSRTMS